MRGAAGGDFRGFVERDRPFIDDQPDHKYGWEALSRWGSRPPREFGRGLGRVATRVKGFTNRAWTLIRDAARDRG